ncbi:MAG: acyl-CoA dehydrogenase [Gammaproteobacteria bacterium]|nr:MAG: acyl-CoA dehydrogenase [Gammaproteobacteria bacterium]TLZ29660.1 MAG: acyl-CoA dehydrogenase [Gammaproteobacteria bacterium]
MNPAPRAARAGQRPGVAGGSPAATDSTAHRAPGEGSVERALSDEMLARFASRAATYDRENRFFDEDFMELRAARYLLLAVPAELGGAGMSLAQVCREQRRLAYHAPATALAVNMHLYWTGVAADLWRRGDASLEWLLREAVAGEIFAAGHAESGNDVPVLLSTTKAERVEGGYRFTGRKQFGSLTPVWTRFGLHGMETSDPSRPKIVHAFMSRDDAGYIIKETWDVLGMRATRSDDTVLDQAFVPDRYVARVVPAGGAGLDPFVMSVFAWALLGFGNIYYGLAKRALDVSIAAVKSKRSLALSRSMAYHPEAQHAIADMVIELEAIEPHLEAVAADWSNGVDHGAAWPSKVFAAKYHAVEGSWRVVDLGLDVTGGYGIFRSAGYERLVRDARLGRIHPANSFLTHEVVAKTALGISLDEQPRWG